MRYSLSSRFRGTLLGAVVGEMLAGKGIVDKYPQPLSAPAWELIAAASAQSLIRLGKYDLEDWQKMLLSVEADIFPRLFNPSLTISAKAIISTLPISLFYHENPTKLRQNLQNFLAAVGQDNPVSQDAALAVGYAIAQSLTEKLHKATLIPQIIAFIGLETKFTQQLAQVQILLEQEAGLERVRTCLHEDAAGASTSIALAFYCFLSTLEDLRLSVMRATQFEVQNISAITGALSGAYNSTSGISTTMRTLSTTYIKSLGAWGMKTEAEMLELADSLVAVWSGVYEATSPNKLISVAAIAAPNVIRL